MRLHTASETINFAERLENESADFYADLSRSHKQLEDVFRSFAAENKKNVQEVKRAYYEVITDAIEGGFAFDVETDNYSMSPILGSSTDLPEALKKALRLEELIARFYRESAAQAAALLCDVPRAFLKVAKRREGRIARLDTMRRVG
ncbi:MAG: hypothetical protein HY673_00410 [Chloroflexi bacterium]|nr:hypothetical protein [Chloroflexota bacterium]